MFTERLWRTIKHEEVYRHEYENGWMAEDWLGRHFEFYNQKRPHQSLDWDAPAKRDFGGKKLAQETRPLQQAADILAVGSDISAAKKDLNGWEVVS